MNEISTKKNLNSITQETYEAGETIFTEGEIGYHLYIIEKGQVEIFTKNNHGKKIQIAVIEEGESFGEFALLDKKPRSASAMALTNCQVTKISPQGYEQLLSELPTWAISMMTAFMNRIKHSNEILQKVPQFLSKD